MPRPPNPSTSLAAISGSLFSMLAHRLEGYAGEVYPLHVGDTWREPAVGCRMQDLTAEEHPGLHQYAPPHGIPGLLDAIVDHVEACSGAATERRDVLVSAGATGALGAVAGAILDQGDEILLLAPYWPLIAGIVHSSGAIPIEVPFIGEVDSPLAAREALQERLTPKTVAIYLSSPNNPTGRVIPPAWLTEIVEWARSARLWIISDEVYENCVYRGQHTYTRPIAPECTFSVHSFSKTYGMAGNRCGYVVGPGSFMPHLLKVSTHAFYSTPTASQIAAQRALKGQADDWLRTTIELYRQMGDDAAARLGLEPPDGSTFLFFDVSPVLDEHGLLGFLERCVKNGLFVAPGTSFGNYPSHIRICFTAAPPEVVSRGISVLASLLGR